jgi:hypothetical protein
MKCRSKWGFASSSSRIIASDSRSGLARIRFPSGSIISERVSGEIEMLFPRETSNRIEPAEATPAEKIAPLPRN